MKVPDDTVTTASELSHMGEMLEQVYLQNHLVAVTEKKASVLGYAKIFRNFAEEPAWIRMLSWDTGMGNGVRMNSMFCAQ